MSVHVTDSAGRPASRRAQPPAAPGGAARGLAAAHRRRRGVGQDGRAHPADRLPAGRPRRRRRAGAGHHVHQQGRRRDARAGGAAGRPAGPVDVGVDVPLDLRAHPAQPGVAAAGAELQLLDLRRRRLAAAAADDRQGHGPGHQAVLAAVAGQRDLEPQERADRARAGRGRGVGGARRSSPASSPRCTASTSAGCARPTRWTSTTSSARQSLCCKPFRRSPSTTGGGSGTSWSTSTRTPTTRSTCWCASWSARRPHKTMKPQWRPPSCVSSATPTSRSTRSAARPSATSKTSNATSPTPQRFCSSRTTARRRTSCRRPTPSSRATAGAARSGCGPTRAKANSSSATSPTTNTTRPGSSPRRSTRSPTAATSPTTTSRCSTAPTTRHARWKRCSSGPASRTKSLAAFGFTSARRSATSSPT